MCATCGSKTYGQADTNQLSAIKKDKAKLARVRAYRDAKHKALQKNKQTKRIK